MKKRFITFLKELFTENPLFVASLGMCGALAVTITVENALMMGFSVLLVLVCSNLIISLVAPFIASEIRIPAYIVIIATFVTILELLMAAYVPSLFQALGIYLPLIVVNCIILGRALAFASHHKVKASLIDGLKGGLGFTIALVILGAIREIIGSNQITLMDKVSSLTGYEAKYQILPVNDIIPNQLLLSPAGAFITLGLIVMVLNIIRKRGSASESN